MTISDMTSGGHLKARLKSLETSPRQLTARHGEQLFADVEVTVHQRTHCQTREFQNHLRARVQNFANIAVSTHIRFPVQRD